MKFFEYRIKKVSFTDEHIVIETADGKKGALPIANFPKLLKASASARQSFEIVGNGYALHWKDLDEDLSAAGFFEHKQEKVSVRK